MAGMVSPHWRIAPSNAERACLPVGRDCGIRIVKTDETHSIHTNPTNVIRRASCRKAPAYANLLRQGYGGQEASAGRQGVRSNTYLFLFILVT